MKKQRKSSQETILQCWGRVLVPPQGTYITVSLSSSARTKAPTHVEGGNYMLRPQTGWNLKADDWDSWSTTLLPHHQPIRRKSVTLQTSPQILPVKTSPWKSSGSSGDFEHKPPVLLAWLCNKPFSAPSSDVSVCMDSSCLGHMNLRLLSWRGLGQWKAVDFLFTIALPPSSLSIKVLSFPCHRETCTWLIMVVYPKFKFSAGPE